MSLENKVSKLLLPVDGDTKAGKYWKFDLYQTIIFKSGDFELYDCSNDPDPNGGIKLNYKRAA
jgi:hypothetical protein